MDLLAQIETRLRTLAELKQVAGAVSFAALQDSGKLPPPHRQPAAWVVPVSEQASANRLAAGAHRQRVRVTFGVVLGLGQRNDPHGEAAVDQAKPLADLVRGHLAGWTPDGFETVAYRQGRALGYVQGWVWWLAEFETGETISRHTQGS